MTFSKKDKHKENVVELWCNLLSCWLITIATGIVFDGYFEMQLGVFAVVWQTLFSLIVTVIITKCWRISAAVLGSLAVIVLVVLGIYTDIKSVFKLIFEFFNWWFDRCPKDSPFYNDRTFYIVHTLINIGVTVLYYTISKITKKSWVTVAVAFLIVGISFIKGYTNYDFWALPFFVVGIFPLVAAEKFQNIKIPDLKNLFGVLDKKWLYIIISTFVAIVVCITSISVLSLIKDSVRTRFCTDVVSDIQSLTNIYTKEQKNRKVSLFDLGLVSDSTYIGGDIADIPSGVLATTNLTEPTLVKITAFDSFDGMVWKNNDESAYRIGGPWEDEEKTYLSTRLINDSRFLSGIKNIAEIKKVEVTIEHPSHIIPTVGQVSNFKELTKNKNQVLFDTCGRLLSFYGQDAGFKYSFDTVIYDTKNEKIRRKLRDIIAHYGNGRDPFYDKESEFFKRYTEKIKGGEDYIPRIIESLKFDVENYYDKAFKICEFFSDKNGYIYSNDVPAFKKGDNIIDSMFDNKKGHSLYYSTTMIAMTRSVGIPSRLAAGYRTVESEKTGLQVVDRAYPYVWVECYIPHIGWVSFDPTPQIQVEDAYDEESDGSNDIQEDEEESILQPPGTNLEWNSGPDIPLIVVLAVLAVALISALVNILFSQKFYVLTGVRKRYKDTRKQAKYYYLDILRQFAWLGFRFKKGETMKELGQRAFEGINLGYAEKFEKVIASVEKICCEDLSPSEKEAEQTLTASSELKNVLVERNKKVFAIIDEGIKVIEALTYGGIVPSNIDIETLYNTRQALESVLKDQNSKLGYILKRRLLLPVFNVNLRLKI